MKVKALPCLRVLSVRCLGWATMSAPQSENIQWHAGAVTPADRRANMGQSGATVWFTGLSGSGKSTVAVAVERALLRRGRHVYRLDGDNIRFGLCRDLGFSGQDRTENIRRVGEVTRLFADAGMICLNSFISPRQSDRDAVRALHTADGGGPAFLEVHVDVPLQEAERRDPKGLYKKARAGQISEFTGISAPYEAPVKPELRLNTAEQPLEACVDAVVRALNDRGLLDPA